MSLSKKAHSHDSQLLDCIMCWINAQCPPPYKLCISVFVLKTSHQTSNDYKCPKYYITRSDL